MVGSSSNIGMYLTESVCNVLRDARDGTYGVFVLCQQQYTALADKWK